MTKATSTGPSRAALVVLGPMPCSEGWRVRYRWTATDRRRTQFVSPEGTVYEVCSAARATHIRRHPAPFSPTFLKVV